MMRGMTTSEERPALEVGTRVSYYDRKASAFRPSDRRHRGVVTRVTEAGTVFVRPDHQDKELRFAAGSVGSWTGVQALSAYQLATERWWSELPRLKLVDVSSGFAGSSDPHVSVTGRGLRIDPEYLRELATELRAVAAWLAVRPVPPREVVEADQARRNSCGTLLEHCHERDDHHGDGPCAACHDEVA